MSVKKWMPILIILIFLYPFSEIQGEKQEEMNVHFINVGQGDSILIETPTNKVILIDAGPPTAGKKIVKYLTEHNIRKIDLLIATHPDIDHIGGVPHVMKSVQVDQILDSGKLHTTKTYLRYINQIKKQRTPVKIAKQDEKIKIDSLLDIQVLNTYKHSKNNNQSSIVLKVSYQDIDFLLMGDAEKDQEKKLINKYNLEANIVKIAHHGSKTSSSLEFLKKVNPDIALITYSKKNKYGHPVNPVIERLNKVHAQIYSTAVFGNIVIRTNGKNYFIVLEKSPIDGLFEKSS